jgi:autotransporter passenger strand-loop-strand repeat protein
VSSGGAEYVSAGGTANGTTINSGGTEYIFNGGSAGNTTIAGGTLEIMSGGTAGTGTIGFAGAGTLKLDHYTGFGTPTISGMVDTSQKIDLADISFSTATLGYSGNALSGTLTVADGTHTATLALLGQYTAANFTLGNDGSGGTLVSDPPLQNLAGQPFLAS